LGCSLCNDTGWKRVDVDGVRRVARCECWRDKVVQSALAASRIPPRYRKASFDNFETHNDSLIVALRAAREFAAAFPAVRRGLLFIGLPGVGKTHLAAAVLKETILNVGARAIFYDTRELLRLIRDTYNPTVKTTETDVIRPVMEAELLVLDDLGAEKTTEWVDETMNLIVNTRYNYNRPTIFTTNYPDDDPEERAVRDVLIERIGARMHSRLHEMCEFIPMEAVDHRKLGPDASAEAIARLDRRGRSVETSLPGPGRAKAARAQLQRRIPFPDGKADLKWPGGKAGT
jgi:DNA replication protein DnaC